MAFFVSLYLYDIDDGSKPKFWRDRWCGETPLTVSYLDLFRILRDKEASVAELMKFTNWVLYWDISFFRGSAYFTEEHFVKPSNLFSIFVYYSITCSGQIREDSEEFSLGEI